MTKTPNATRQPNYPDQIISDNPQPGAEHAALIAADLRRMEQEARELPGPSPTAGMNLGQRILHVGGRENAAGYIEFGSVAAVRALVSQVLRDLQAAPPAPAAVAVPEGWRWMTHPDRNNGQPIPVRIEVEDGVTYYRPFDERGTDFEWDKRGDEWVEITAPAQEHATQLAGQGQEVPSTRAGLLAAAAYIQAKASAHAEECGSYDPDTGAFEMRDAVQDHYNTLDELAEEIRLLADKAVPKTCDKPPAGWTCSRTPGHDGPCAAAPAVDAPEAERDAAFEAVRNRLCCLQRYSFVLDNDGVVRRARDRTGSWIEFDEAHALFDPVAVDAAIAARVAQRSAA